MIIRKIEYDKAYQLTNFSFQFSLSNNILQTRDAENEVLSTIVNDTIYNQFKLLDKGIQVYISNFISESFHRLKHNKTYLFKVKVNQKQTHALLSLSEKGA